MAPPKPPNLLRRFAAFLGFASLQAAGRDAVIIISLRSLRMFASGIPSIILALFYASLDFSEPLIGAFMTLTLVGDVLLSLLLTLVADAIGRRRVLLVGSALMAAAGVAFALSESKFVLLVAAVAGVISVTGADAGPFRAVEESVLSGLAGESERSDVLAWYVTVTTFAGAVGTEIAGRVVTGVEGWMKGRGSGEKEAFHVLFWGYAGLGLLGCVLSLGLSEKCEVTWEKSRAGGKERGEGGEEEEEEVLLEEMPVRHETTAMAASKKTKKSLFSQISRSSLKVLLPLWALLALDSFSDGLTPFPLLNYYLTQKFALQKSTLGDITSLSQFLCAVSSIFASPLARHIGLINTMVFTHLPSSLANTFIPVPKSIGMTVVLLLIKAGLNSMDQAPRSAFIAAVVKSEERTAVMGITQTLRIGAISIGPAVTGWLAGSDHFWAAWVVGGVCRVVYDLGLWVLFVGYKIKGDEKDEERDERAGHEEDEFGVGDEAWEGLLGSDSEEGSSEGRESKDGSVRGKGV